VVVVRHAWSPRGVLHASASVGRRRIAAVSALDPFMTHCISRTKIETLLKSLLNFKNLIDSLLNSRLNRKEPIETLLKPLLISKGLARTSTSWVRFRCMSSSRVSSSPAVLSRLLVAAAMASSAFFTSAARFALIFARFSSLRRGWAGATQPSAGLLGWLQVKPLLHFKRVGRSHSAKCWRARCEPAPTDDARGCR
jgi:hypothetical protein